MNEGIVTFEDNGKGNIIGIDNIHISPSTSIQNVSLVDGLKYNLLGISQFCDKKYKVTFELLLCIVFIPNDNGIIFIGHRYDNVCMVDLDDLQMKNGQYLIIMDAKVSETK